MRLYQIFILGLIFQVQQPIADLQSAITIFEQPGNDNAAQTARLKLSELQQSDTVKKAQYPR